MASIKLTGSQKNGKTNVSLKSETETVLEGDKRKLSLLEKAQLYKERNPEMWQARHSDRERVHKKMIGAFVKQNSFLEIYNTQQRRRSKAKVEMLEKMEKAPRTVVVQLKFVTHSQARMRTGRRATIINIMETSEDGQSVYYNSNNKSVDTNQSELTVTAMEGENLFNHLPDDESMSEKCCVNLALCPDSEKRAMKSSSCAITLQGFTRWDHKFVLRGFSTEDLKNKYLKIFVSGQSTSGKVFIGQAVIAGQGALIKMEDSKPRKPTTAEVEPLEKAISNPEQIVTATLDLCLKSSP